MVVLDTDHVSLLEWPKEEGAHRLRARLEQIHQEPVVTTIINYEEQTRGWLTYMARAKTIAQQINAYSQLRQHLDVYRPIKVLDFDERAAGHYQRLQHARIRIGTMDLKIASIVLANDATLLIRNLGDFRKVPDWKVEDWTA